MIYFVSPHYQNNDVYLTTFFHEKHILSCFHMEGLARNTWIFAYPNDLTTDIGVLSPFVNRKRVRKQNGGRMSSGGKHLDRC